MSRRIEVMIGNYFFDDGVESDWRCKYPIGERVPPRYAVVADGLCRAVPPAGLRSGGLSIGRASVLE